MLFSFRKELNKLLKNIDKEIEAWNIQKQRLLKQIKTNRPINKDFAKRHVKWCEEKIEVINKEIETLQEAKVVFRRSKG